MKPEVTKNETICGLGEDGACELLTVHAEEIEGLLALCKAHIPKAERLLRRYGVDYPLHLYGSPKVKPFCQIREYDASLHFPLMMLELDGECDFAVVALTMCPCHQERNEKRYMERGMRNLSWQPLPLRIMTKYRRGDTICTIPFFYHAEPSPEALISVIFPIVAVVVASVHHRGVKMATLETPHELLPRTFDMWMRKDGTLVLAYGAYNYMKKLTVGAGGMIVVSPMELMAFLEEVDAEVAVRFLSQEIWLRQDDLTNEVYDNEVYDENPKAPTRPPL